MTPRQCIAFVTNHGITLESAHGPVPNLAEAIAAEPIRGSYWSHPKSNEIFLCSRAIRKSADVLVCRLVEGKVTYIHRRLWAALVRIASRFDSNRLAAIREVHTPSGKHIVKTTPFFDWVTKDVSCAANRLSEKEAELLLAAVLTKHPTKKTRNGR